MTPLFLKKLFWIKKLVIPKDPLPILPVMQYLPSKIKELSSSLTSDFFFFSSLGFGYYYIKLLN